MPLNDLVPASPAACHVELRNSSNGWTPRTSAVAGLRAGILLAALMDCGVAAAAPDDAPARPHVVIILADDMGFGDVSSNNPRARTKTPNLDELGRQGIRFTEAHSSGSTCIPSRYGLVTGRYQFRDAAAPKGPDMAKLGGAGYLPPLIEPGRETI